MSHIMSNDDFERLLEHAIIKNIDLMLEEIPPLEDLVKIYPISETYKLRIKKMFSYVRRWDIVKKISKVMRVAVASVAIITTLLFGTLMIFSYDVRATVSKTIIEWFEGFTRFIGGQSDNNFSPSDWQPSYLPEGFSEQEFLDLGEIIRFSYENLEGVEIRFRVSNGESAVFVDNDGVSYRQIVDDEVTYHIFEATDEQNLNSVLWLEGGFSFEVFSVISIQELLNIAKSVQYN